MTHLISPKAIATICGIAALTVVSCNSDKSASGLVTINLEPNVDAPLTGADRIEARIMLHPAFTDTTMLKDPQLINVVDSKAYILSDRSELMVFDCSDGRCIGSFNHQGGGPEEYPQLNSASVGADGNWQILSTNGVYTYTPRGEFVARNIMDSITSIAPIGSDWAAFKKINESGYQPMVFFNSDWKQIKAVESPATATIIEIPGGMLTLQSYLQSNGDFISSDTLYHINAKTTEIAPIVAFNAGKYTMPDLTTIDDYREIWDVRRTHLGLISALPIANDQVLAYYSLEGTMTMQIYNLNDGSLTYSNPYDLKSGGFPIEIDDKTYACTAAYCVSGDHFFMIATDDSMAEITGDENANPAIVELRLK